MNAVRSRARWMVGFATTALLLGAAAETQAQNTKMPSTLRYGSGYLDVPVASVLPHLAITGTYSAFNINLDDGTDFGWFGDGSVAIGLFDRVEVGGTFQTFKDEDVGASLVGAFGRLAILQPVQDGLGLAVGARYMTSPDFGATADAGAEYQPGRLGYSSRSLRKNAGPGTSIQPVSTNFSPYAVASAHLQGFESNWFPENDWTLSLGWGDGIFRDGYDNDIYSTPWGNSNGWLVGSALHLQLSDNTLLNLMGEYNGWETNLGAQLDVNGFRVGAFVLGANHYDNLTTYRSSKFGVLGSVALCPAQGGLCRPSLMDRPEPQVVRVVTPPDTVVVEREVAPPLPTGTPATMCLATGENVNVLITAQGDTLVGPQRVSVRQLRPGVVFAGAYAEGRPWFVADEAIPFEDRNYSKSGGEVRLDCANIMRVGEHMGVGLFADARADRPYETLYVPVRPGVWQAYQAGLQRTRG
ncbi:MAG: hypothetical protein WEA09_01915 [Gemmatimonadota bacterium]